MPATARTIQRRISSKKLYNPRTNIRIGTRYFKKLFSKYEGNLAYTLMAYNAGEGNLKDWKSRIFRNDGLVHLIESIPFNETRNYVKLIFRNLYFYSAITRDEESKVFLRDLIDKNLEI